MFKKHKVRLINKELLMVFFVIAVLFFKYDLNLRINENYFHKQVEESIKKHTPKATVSYRDKAIIEDNVSDFEESEVEGLELFSYTFYPHKFQFFEEENRNVEGVEKVESPSKQPLYILFCKLKIHLA